MNSRVFVSVLLLFFSVQAFSHGGDDGPSSLESEFAKLSHLHFPFNYSTKEGVLFGYELLNSEHESEDGNDSHGIDINMHPVLFGGVDKIKNYICLEEGNTIQIEACSESSPYALFETKKWDLGLGAEADVHLPIPMFSAGLGISYLKGKNHYSLRMLKHKNEVREALLLPVSQKNLSQWRPGDQFAYYSKGSLVINIFIGVEPIFHLGPEYIHSGVYKIQVKMIDEKTLFVNIASLSSNAVGAEVNGVILNVEGTQSTGKSIALNFEFNLKNPNAFEALNALFAGKINKTQKLIEKYKDLANLKIDLDTKGTSISGNLGIPMLYATGGGVFNFSSEGEIEDVEQDGQRDEHESYTSSKGKERFSRGVISKHFWENSSVSTSVLRELGITAEDSAMNTAFYLIFSKDKMNIARLEKKINRIAARWGITGLKNVNLPSVDKGYLKLEFLVQWKGMDILRLLNTENLKVIKAQGLVNRKFINTHEQLTDLRNKIEESYAKKDLSDVTAQVNQFMKVFMGSKVHFQIYSKLFGQPLVQLKLEGENIARTSILL